MFSLLGFSGVLLGWTSGYELIVVALVALLLFGHRLPSIMRSLGSGINEFKKGMAEGDTDATSDASNIDHKSVT